MKDRIVFWADGNSDIGLGHVYRSLALLDMLKSDFDCTFCTRSEDAIVTIIEQHTSNIKSLPKDDTAFEIFVNHLTGNEIVVLDNYFFTGEYQKKVKEQGCKLVCIDDIPERHFFADVVLNHSPGAETLNYSTASSTKRLFGLNYLILRKEFLEKAREIKVKQTTKNKFNVFVCFGGSDPQNLTWRTVQQLGECQLIDEINVVVGPAYSKNRLLELNKLGDRINLTIDADVEVMIEKMCQSDFGIVPASGIMLECLSLQLPVISGFYVENQKNIASYFERKNIGEMVGDLTQLVVSDEIVKRVMNVDFNLGLIDGWSSQRILEEFKKL